MNMAKPKVALSYGHGSNTYKDKKSKAVLVSGKVYEEHTFNAKVGEMVRKIIEKYVDVLVLQPPNGKDVPLKTRTDRANSWGADLYWSIHANAADPKTRGYTAFYWSTSKDGAKLANEFADNLMKAKFPLYHGGAYPSVKGTWNDFHELRETKMPAILTENGFMTNKEDFKQIFLNEGQAHEKLAAVHAKTILGYFGIKYEPDPVKAPIKKPDNGSKEIYRVIVDGKQVGAYSDPTNLASNVFNNLKKDPKKIIIERV
ncbi:N-acetylmuramoyl-L-alanine amidase [Peribacillus frigoritolerans]|uniref:N-acetylmuramoyl-L-alanine amidase family protein n=1 Tax=Peribacillus frigoritolerans TaxID=450367 RepID=UPI0021D01295|nr:N-acetylmuramoyl-L-alanine amidase [Peribacillus frigoritolerans]MCU6603838.1 N-acetylmuramoyl-L-alanine amidase [Peribacillus frigoritolerans]